MMTEIVYHFTPDAGGAGAGAVSSVDTASRERDGYELTVTSVQGAGSVRVSTTVDSMDKDTLCEVYELASSVQELNCAKYRVSLIISDRQPARTYLDHERDISEFARTRFGEENPVYREIDNTRVKISLSSHKNKVSICG